MPTRFADRNILRKLNHEAARRNYNRQILEQGIDSLAEDAIVAVSPIMIHEHAQGKAVEPHLRCSVQLVYPTATPWNGLTLDVPVEMFEMLPEKQDIETVKTSA